VNPVVLAFRIDKLEAELKKFGDYEHQVEDMQRQITLMKTTIAATRSEKDLSVSISPNRSDIPRDPYLLNTDEKRALIKKRGKILDMKEVQKRTISRSPNTHDKVQDMNK